MKNTVKKFNIGKHMSSHYEDARKIEAIMISNKMEKPHKNLPMIESQDLNLSLKYVKKIIDTEVEPLKRAKLNPVHTSLHQKHVTKREGK